MDDDTIITISARLKGWLKAKLGTGYNKWKDTIKPKLVKERREAKAGLLTAAQWAITLPCVIAYVALLLAIVEAGWVGGFTTAAIIGSTAIGLWLWGWAMEWQDKREQRTAQQRQR